MLLQLSYIQSAFRSSLQTPKTIMQPTELQEIALTLPTARTNRQPIDAPIKTWPNLDPDSAFEVQRIAANHAITNSNDRIVGYNRQHRQKSCKTRSDSTIPTNYGFLLASTFVYEGKLSCLVAVCRRFLWSRLGIGLSRLRIGGPLSLMLFDGRELKC